MTEVKKTKILYVIIKSNWGEASAQRLLENPRFSTLHFSSGATLLYGEESSFPTPISLHPN